MNNKGFLYMIGGVVILGAILGSVFFGGISVGKSRCSNPSDSTCSDEDIRTILSSRFGSDQRSVQPNSGQGEEGFGRGFEGIRGLSGPIEALEGDSITISTAQGPLQAVVSDETVIVMTVTGMLKDLEPGVRVRVVGERGDDGIVAATVITITSEEIQGLPFGGFQRGTGSTTP